MLSWLFGKSSTAQQAAELHLSRIQFLMKYLQQHVLKEKSEVVRVLNRELLLRIPNEMPDPEGRKWFDPSNGSLAISFNCKNQSGPPLVHQFCVAGYDHLANTLVIGTAHGEAEDVVVYWGISVESEARDIPELSKVVQSAFWKMPGWKVIDGFGKIRWLKSI